MGSGTIIGFIRSAGIGVHGAGVNGTCIRANPPAISAGTGGDHRFFSRRESPGIRLRFFGAGVDQGVKTVGMFCKPD